MLRCWIGWNEIWGCHFRQILRVWMQLNLGALCQLSTASHAWTCSLCREPFSTETKTAPSCLCSILPQKQVEDTNSHRNPGPFYLGKQGSVPLGVNVWLLPNHGLPSTSLMLEITWVFGVLGEPGEGMVSACWLLYQHFSDSKMLLLGTASHTSLSFPQGQKVHWSVQNVFLIFIIVVPRAGLMRQESSRLIWRNLSNKHFSIREWNQCGSL